jgi:hypothetical protein
MNERFRQLADQANFGHISKPNTDIQYDPRLSKFVELIVQECIINALKESKWYWDQDEFESANACQNVAMRLTKLCGVKE